MGYYIYGKRIKETVNKKTGETIPPDKRFAALTYDGVRVSRLVDAKIYDTKEDAQQVLNTKVTKRKREEAVFEIRKA